MNSLKRALAALCLGAALAAAPAAQTSVTDYYLRLPADRFATDITGKKIAGKTALNKFRRSLIKIEDAPNGYLRLEGPWEGWAEIALFKRDAGGYLVAETSVGCGPACDGSLRFSTYAAGRWTDVTARYLPKIDAARLFAEFRRRGGVNDEIESGEGLSYYFLLPRAGRTLRVACNECSEEGRTGDGDFVLLEYEWDGAKFVEK